jgi:hypothetical protein
LKVLTLCIFDEKKLDFKSYRFHEAVNFSNCKVGKTKTKTSHHDVRGCEGERLDTTGIGDYWWRCTEGNYGPKYYLLID